jgi:hypothetical protein
MSEPTIFQIYYAPHQLEAIKPPFRPYHNPEKSPLCEFAVFDREFRAGTPEKHALLGYVSWRFHTKTFLEHDAFPRFIAQRPGADVYFVNPFPELAVLYPNVWVQGEKFHKGIIAMAEEALAAEGHRLDLATMPMAPDVTGYCNYWVANAKFWRAYMEFMLPVVARLTDTATPLGKKVAEPAGYVFGESYLPFIIERLFSTFLLVQKHGLKSEAYRYSDLERAQLISRLRVRYEETTAQGVRTAAEAAGSRWRRAFERLTGRS